MMVYSGAIVSEDKSIAPSGTDYVDKPGVIQAFPHESFGSTYTDAQKHYGIIWRAGSSS
jgi:hypothetical protein